MDESLKTRIARKQISIKRRENSNSLNKNKCQAPSQGLKKKTPMFELMICCINSPQPTKAIMSIVTIYSNNQPHLSNQVFMDTSLRKRRVALTNIDRICLPGPHKEKINTYTRDKTGDTMGSSWIAIDPISYFNKHPQFNPVNINIKMNHCSTPMFLIIKNTTLLTIVNRRDKILIQKRKLQCMFQFLEKLHFIKGSVALNKWVPIRVIPA